jgi:hypothetical protein
MDKKLSKAGWILSVAGFVLLLMVGNLGLAAVLIPVAAVLALGVMMLLNHKDGRVTHGIK